MKKKLRLRKEVKEIWLIAAFVAAMAALVIYGVDRIDRINNGEMVVISESYMD
jgi:hypothetical protein